MEDRLVDAVWEMSVAASKQVEDDEAKDAVKNTMSRIEGIKEEIARGRTKH